MKTVDISINLGNKPINEMTDGEMTAWIARDRLITEKNIVEKIQGIGSLTSEHYQDSIDMINDTLGAIHLHSIGAIDDIETEIGLIAKDALDGNYSIAHEICGIGSIHDRINVRQDMQGQRRGYRAMIRKQLTPEQRANIWAIQSKVGQIGKTKTGNFLKKIAKGVKNVTKAITKVALAPMLLSIKGILELQLPKAAPFFYICLLMILNLLPNCRKKFVKNAKRLRVWQILLLMQLA